MNRIIGLLAAVAFFCGGLLETKAHDLLRIEVTGYVYERLSGNVSLSTMQTGFWVKHDVTSFVYPPGFWSNLRGKTLQIPPGLINLKELDLRNFNGKIWLPDDLQSLEVLKLNGTSSFKLPSGLVNLRHLVLENIPTNLQVRTYEGKPIYPENFPFDIQKLEVLDIAGTDVSSFVIPPQFENLKELKLPWNLNQLTAPAGMNVSRFIRSPETQIHYYGHKISIKRVGNRFEVSWMGEDRILQASFRLRNGNWLDVATESPWLTPEGIHKQFFRLKPQE